MSVVSPEVRSIEFWTQDAEIEAETARQSTVFNYFKDGELGGRPNSRADRQAGDSTRWKIQGLLFS